MASNEILFALLLSVIATATNTELSNNTNFLLLMLLALSNDGGSRNRCNWGCCNNPPRLFG